MLRRWAIAEVHVEYLNSINEAPAQETLRLLYSTDPIMEGKGIKRSLKMHHLSLVDCLPSDVVWYLAKLELKQSEFDQLYTLPVFDLAQITNNTYKVSYAAKITQQKPLLNPRISAISEAFKSDPKSVQLSGMIVLAQGIDGPYTIIEGNGRLISLYSFLFLDENSFPLNDPIEVVIGFSDAKFKIDYKYLD